VKYCIYILEKRVVPYCIYPGMLLSYSFEPDLSHTSILYSTIILRAIFGNSKESF